MCAQRQMTGFRARKELIDPATTRTGWRWGVFHGGTPPSTASMRSMCSTSKTLWRHGLRDVLRAVAEKDAVG